MKLLLSFLFLSLTFPAFSSYVDPYRTRLPSENPVCDDSYVELSRLPPLWDQGRFGLCYAHSSALLLEYLRCGHSTNPEACYKHKGSVLNLSRYYNTYSEDKITIGGDAATLLWRFEAVRRVAQESCADYQDWKNLDELHRDEMALLASSASDKDEVDYFYYLFKKLKQNASYDQKACWAQEIVGAGVKQSVQEIVDILNNSQMDYTWQELRYKILVPRACQKDGVTYPDYSVVRYPSEGEKKSFKGFRDQVYRSLKRGYPLEASFCSSQNSDGSCNYHSTTIVGQRHVCDQNSCELQWRIQNSYGKRWQEATDNGWVEAKNFASLMEEDGLGLTTILPQGQQLDSKLSTRYYEASPINAKAEEVRLSSRGKEPSSDEDKCWLVDADSYQEVNHEDPRPAMKPVYHPVTIKPGKKVMYMCRDASGQMSFTDQQIPGQECTPRNY